MGAAMLRVARDRDRASAPHAPNIAGHGARHNGPPSMVATERRHTPQFDNGSTTMPSSSLRESVR
jgi:hypothetical protein